MELSLDETIGIKEDKKDQFYILTTDYGKIHIQQYLNIHVNYKWAQNLSRDRLKMVKKQSAKRLNRNKWSDISTEHSILCEVDYVLISSNNAYFISMPLEFYKFDQQDMKCFFNVISENQLNDQSMKMRAIPIKIEKKKDYYVVDKAYLQSLNVKTLDKSLIFEDYYVTQLLRIEPFIQNECIYFRSLHINLLKETLSSSISTETADRKYIADEKRMAFAMDYSSASASASSSSASSSSASSTSTSSSTKQSQNRKRKKSKIQTIKSGADKLQTKSVVNKTDIVICLLCKIRIKAEDITAHNSYHLIKKEKKQKEQNDDDDDDIKQQQQNDDTKDDYIYTVIQQKEEIPTTTLKYDVGEDNKLCIVQQSASNNFNDRLCLICLSGSCAHRVYKEKIGGKEPTYHESDCILFCKYKYGHYRKSSISKPCSNVPSICPLCGDVIYKYLYLLHYNLKHHQQIQSIPEDLKCDQDELKRVYEKESKRKDQKGVCLVAIPGEAQKITNQETRNKKAGQKWGCFKFDSNNNNNKEISSPPSKRQRIS